MGEREREREAWYRYIYIDKESIEQHNEKHKEKKASWLRWHCEEYSAEALLSRF